MTGKGGPETEKARSFNNSWLPQRGGVDGTRKRAGPSDPDVGLSRFSSELPTVTGEPGSTPTTVLRGFSQERCSKCSKAILEAVDNAVNYMKTGCKDMALHVLTDLRAALEDDHET